MLCYRWVYVIKTRVPKAIKLSNWFKAQRVQVLKHPICLKYKLIAIFKELLKCKNILFTCTIILVEKGDTVRNALYFIYFKAD